MKECKLKSLTIFFPFYNDAGTVVSSINTAFEIGNKVTNDLEVIAIHGGNSKDKTADEIQQAKTIYPNLIIIDKSDNTEGYAVIKHGFKAASKGWVFYTDGDAQYSLEEDLFHLIDKQIETQADVINGYKIKRKDNISRVILGELYARFSRILFNAPIQDIDCDFRLIKKSLIDQITIESRDASILIEMVKKLEYKGAKFAEIPVKHYARIYGESNYKPLHLFLEKLRGDLSMYFKLKKHRTLYEKHQIFRFMSVGFISVSLQWLLFNIFTFKFNVPLFISTVLSDQVSIFISFYGNKNYTFQNSKIKSIYRTFTKFYITVLTSTLLQALVVTIGGLIVRKNFILTNLIFISSYLAAFVWNYFIQKRLVWKNKY